MGFHILLTNDDGVQAPGLLALSQSLNPVGQVTILAPDRNWTASGHVKTMHRPLRAWPTLLADGRQALACDGAPSDCVALGVLGLISPKIDLVVSGINPLANVGHDVTYSGTVTAAMEAAIAGIPGIAVSLDSHPELDRQADYSTAAEITRQLALQVKAHGLPDGVFLNVNVPDRGLEDLAGMEVTRQGMRLYRDALVERLDPRGRPYYWIGGEEPSGVSDPGTDFWALEQGMVSITPLQLDLTAKDRLTAFEAWLLDLPSAH
jgi:5'-nucleotidase